VLQLGLAEGPPAFSYTARACYVREGSFKPRTCAACAALVDGLVRMCFINKLPARPRHPRRMKRASAVSKFFPRPQSEVSV